MLRSGRAQMVVQADRADLGPAFTYLLFDAHDASQSCRKDRAVNFDPAEGWTHSALQVELGGFPFTALGHRTERALADDRRIAGSGSGVVGWRHSSHGTNRRLG